MYKHTAPPPPLLGMGSLGDMWGTPPPTSRNLLQHCLYFGWGILCSVICYTADCVSAGIMTIGLGVW